MDSLKFPELGPIQEFQWTYRDNSWDVWSKTKVTFQGCEAYVKVEAIEVGIPFEHSPKDENIVSGTVKWDGCCHLNFGSEGYLHFCGPGCFVRQAELLRFIYCMSACYMKSVKPTTDQRDHINDSMDLVDMYKQGPIGYYKPWQE